MRGIAEFNFPAFEAATGQLRYHGYKVISPAEQDLGRGFDPTGLTGHEDLSSLGFDLREALIADLNHIAFECDAICLLPGWEDSKGARAELALAVALGLSAGTLASFASNMLIPARDFADSLRTQDDIKHQFEAMTEHEYLTGEAFPPIVEVDMAKAVVDQIGERLGADSIFQAEKLDRLDHFLTSGARCASLFDRYGVVDTPPCSNCNDRKCMDCVLRVIHDECRDDCPDCCERQVRSAWLDTDVLPLKQDETRVTSSTGGQKGQKLARFELIPTGPLWDVAELYGRGAEKYTQYGECTCVLNAVNRSSTEKPHEPGCPALSIVRRGDRNWEDGYDWSLSYAALQRHANRFWSRKEDDDPETGLPHLAAVVFHALALMEYRTTHPEFDDRPGR